MKMLVITQVNLQRLVIHHESSLAIRAMMKRDRCRLPMLPSSGDITSTCRKTGQEMACLAVSSETLLGLLKSGPLILDLMCLVKISSCQ